MSRGGLDGDVLVRPGLEKSASGLGFDRAILVGLDGAGEYVQVHDHSLTVVPANFRHDRRECPAPDTGRPLDVP